MDTIELFYVLIFNLFFKFLKYNQYDQFKYDIDLSNFKAQIHTVNA